MRNPLKQKMKPKLEDGFINVKEDLLLYIFLFIMGLPVPYLNFVISIKIPHLKLCGQLGLSPLRDVNL